MNLPPNEILIVLLAQVLFYEVAGAVIGHWHDDLRFWVRRVVERKRGADQKEAAEDSERAWERIEFFHGHGFQFTLLTAFLVFVAANLKLSAFQKTLLSWTLVTSGTLYSLGWLFAGVLALPWGRKKARRIASYAFFTPFGVLFILSSVALFLVAIL